MMRKSFVCCSHNRAESIDLNNADDRIMTHNGLESLVLNSNFCKNIRPVKDDDYATDFMCEDSSTCSSSNTSEFSSPWKMNGNDHDVNEWEVLDNSSSVYGKRRSGYTIQPLDLVFMKEKFAKLLLGDDITGGHKGMSSALALSKAITNLSVSIFGDMWKVEPLSEDTKKKWCMEMDWLVSPAHHMVELVSSKQEGTNGRALEVMVSRTRTDIHVYLPALRMLDSMLLDAINSPFYPHFSRKQILSLGKVVYQTLKAARAINQAILQEMPVPALLVDSFSKSGRDRLGERLYQALVSDSCLEEALKSLDVQNDRIALEVVDKLESTVYSWQGKLGKRSPTKSWPFKRDPKYRIEPRLRRAEALLQHIKHEYPNLPQSFLEASKVQYGKDVGHSILEAYSRVIGNVSFKVLGRIGDHLLGDLGEGRDFYGTRLERFRSLLMESTAGSGLGDSEH